MELLKLLSANELVAQIITFLVLFFLMKHLAWKPFLKVLDDRRGKIALEFKNIEDAKIAAGKARADYEQKLSSIEAEARSRIHAAVEEGRKQAEELRQSARKESDEILVKARENIKQEIAKAEEELKDKIVNLTVDIAAKVIEERLSVEDDAAIVETFIKKLEKS